MTFARNPTLGISFADTANALRFLLGPRLRALAAVLRGSRALLLVWLCVCTLVGPGYAAGDSLEQVRQRGVLRWGGDIQGGEPYVFHDANDTERLIGFEVEIAAELARRLGVRQEFVQNDWQHLVASLQRGDFDVVLNGLEVTAARQTQIALSRPYYAFDELLVVRQEQNAVHGLRDLEGKRVGTLNGSLAQDLLALHPTIMPVLYEGVEEPYIDLEQRRIDAVLLDHIIAERYGLVRPYLRRAGVVGSGVYAIGVRREDSELLAAINRGLSEMTQDGSLRRILQRWQLWNEIQGSIDAGTASPLPRSTTAPAFTIGHLLLFLRGAAITLAISVMAMALAVCGGLMLGIARHYGHPLLRWSGTLYVELFRGTPVLLQLYVLYYGLAPLLALNAFVAAVLGLGLNYAAYEAELYRAGIQAVPIGQTEAALALGMSRWVTLRRIVLPQAIRVALPGMANDFIALLKDSSLVSVITVVELTKQMTITAVDVRGWLIPGLVCAAFYLALSYPLSRLAQRLERRLSPHLA